MKRLLLDKRVARTVGTALGRTTLASRPSIIVPTRFHASSTDDPTTDFSSYYRVEVSNTARADATKLTVRGPDVAGLLASMTVSIAQQGCSVVELHAANAYREPDMKHRTMTEDGQILDTFFLVEGTSGQPLPNEALEPLAHALLEGLKTPMYGLPGHHHTAAVLNTLKPAPDRASQITIVPSGDDV